MTLHARMKGETLTGFGGRLQVRTEDSQGNLVQNFVSDGLTGTFDWKYQSVTFTVPDGVDHGDVYLRVDTTDGGVAYFDDAALYEGEGNLLGNEGFESPGYWNDTLYGMLESAARSYDNTAYLIKEPPMGTSMYNITPSTDDRTIYSAHFYTPIQFTHQGIYDYSYPVYYPDESKGWDSSFIYQQLDKVVLNWLSDYDIPPERFLMGEFGAVRPGVQSEIGDVGQAEWIEDLISNMETVGIQHWLHLSYGEGWNGWNDTYLPEEATYQKYTCPPAPDSHRAFGGIIGDSLAVVLDWTEGTTVISVNEEMEDVGEDNVPYYWESGSSAADSETKRNGSYSLKISDTTSGIYTTSQDICVAEGHRYSVHAYVKTVDVTGNGARLLIEYFDKDGNEITGESWGGSSWQTGTVDWTIRGNLITAPTGCVQMKIILKLDGEGTVYFDDVEVEFID